MTNLKKIIIEMKKQQNILYSNNFIISIFSNLYLFENTITIELFDLLLDLFSNEYIVHNTILFNNILLKNLILHDKYSFVTKYLENYLIVNNFGEIENFYKINKYSLNIKKIFYCQYINSINDNIDTENNDIPDKKLKEKNSQDFIIIINLDNDIINLIVNNVNYPIQKNSMILLSNKHNYELTFCNDNKFLVIIVNYFNGYNKYDYNEHPNLKL